MPIFKTKLLHRINQRTEHYVTKNMSDVDVSEAKNELNYLSKSEEVLLKDRGYTFNRKLGRCQRHNSIMLLVILCPFQLAYSEMSNFYYTLP